ncbi:hypothetical protein LXA43DRAFT_646274 [Ganoderma leucocontextum]|nr:hypothetical protein LXA43DRAFT_646274 [Ganoderma leucocontextum]
MTPCESALACYDILATIFDHLAPSRPDGYKETEDLRHSCRKALASSAVACSTLSHHALNCLWRELDSILPLLKTLPNCKVVDSRLVLCGAIWDEQWTRFQLYADRVRVIETLAGLSGPGPVVHPIHPSVWLCLAVRCRGSPLMPRLRELRAYDLDISEPSAFVILMSPTLRLLDIIFALEGEEEDCQIAPHVASSLLQTLPFMAPNLETYIYEVDISPSHGYIEAFRQFTRLKKLIIGESNLDLDEHALRILSTVPTLRDLSCTIDFPSSSSLALPQRMFQQLTALDVTGYFDHLTAFIHACQLSNLARITLRIEQRPRAGEPVDLFAAVCQCCNPASLTSLSVGILYAAIPSEPRPKCLMEYFEPLLAISNMKLFQLDFSFIMPSINDDDLARFGAAWPQLSSFRVSNFHGKCSDPELARPSLSGLIELARRCPHLDSFRVPELDASVVPEKTAALPLGHGLRALETSHNVILPAPLPDSESSMHLEEVATVLNRVFPSIDLEGARERPRGDSDAQGWHEILRLSEAMRLQVGCETGGMYPGQP